MTDRVYAQNKIGCLGARPGIRVVFSSFLCDPEYELIKRTWKERLFSRPWNPRRKFRQVLKELNPLMYHVSDPQGGIMIVSHPFYEESLRRLPLFVDG